tara:strand:- start:3424 stop:3576 length:153 start_codon:yes stop_codon:yes gene_type:complete
MEVVLPVIEPILLYADFQYFTNYNRTPIVPLWNFQSSKIVLEFMTAFIFP